VNELNSGDYQILQLETEFCPSGTSECIFVTIKTCKFYKTGTSECIFVIIKIVNFEYSYLNLNVVYYQKHCKLSDDVLSIFDTIRECD